MNKTSKRLGMGKTNYANSHGLVNPDNRSCAYDIAVLCEHAMSNPKFREIVGCRVYKTVITYRPNKQNINTNHYNNNSQEKSANIRK